MKNFIVLVFIGLMTFATSAFALPAFARQMGISCSACHSQSGYPALNRFGRTFKANGYAMVGVEKTISDDAGKNNFMSLTDTLNMSLMANMGYSKSSSSPTSINIPNEASMFVGGRIANGVGTFTEMGYDAETNKFTLSNMRLAFVKQISDYVIGIVPYLTDAGGPSSTTDMLNAGGVVSSLGDMFSAQMYVQAPVSGDEGVAAEGISAYIYNDLWNAAYSKWIPKNGTAKQAEFANFASIALTPQIGGWDVDFGAELWWGTSQVQNDINPLLLDRQSTDSYALKFQARGLIGKVPVSFYGAYAKSKNNGDSVYVTSVNDKNAATVSTEVAVIPRVVMLSAGYRNADNGDATNSSDNATLLGLRYFYRENVQFRVGYMYLLDATSDKHNLTATLDLAL